MGLDGFARNSFAQRTRRNAPFAIPAHQQADE
jgi:hypothetical protein